MSPRGSLLVRGDWALLPRVKRSGKEKDVQGKSWKKICLSLPFSPVSFAAVQNFHLALLRVLLANSHSLMGEITNSSDRHARLLPQHSASREPTKTSSDQICSALTSLGSKAKSIGFCETPSHLPLTMMTEDTQALLCHAR